MRELIDKNNVEENRHRIVRCIQDGEVFVYPTDTIYGLGCDATNHDSVERIREIKERQDLPFSVIAPSKEWIREVCEVNEEAEEWLEKLPGPYTLILNLKEDDAVCEKTNNGVGTLGVRIPDHWFTEALQDTGRPVITTSVNRSGREIMTSLDDMSHKIKAKVDFIIYEGEKTGKPSTIVDLTKEETKVIER